MLCATVRAVQREARGRLAARLQTMRGLHATHALGAATRGLFLAGSNKNGQLGTGGSKSAKFVRVELGGGSVVSAACGGKHSAACDEEGRLWTWGLGKHGQLGHGSWSNESKPKEVKALEGVKIVKVACGKYQTACLSEHGHVYTFGWGGADLFGLVKGPGALGVGDRTSRNVPSVVEKLTGSVVTDIVSGDYHMAAKTSAGIFHMWGNGEYGRLGFGDSTPRLEPQQFSFAEGEVKKLSMGASHSAGISDKGVLLTWGQNEQGQCGRSGGDVFSMDRHPIPVSLLADHVIVDVGCGVSHTVAINDKNELYIFGGRQFFSPTHLINLTALEPVGVVCGKMNLFALTKSGSLVVFGRNSDGQLGVAAKQLRDPQVLPEFEGRAPVVSCGSAHSAIVADVE